VSRSKVCHAILENCWDPVDGDDINQFEYLSNRIDGHFEDIKNLIEYHGFIPSPRLTPSAPFRILTMAAKDIEFVRRLIRDQGMLIDDVNDSVLNMLLSNFATSDTQLLLDLVALGFQLTPNIIQVQFRKLSTELLDALLQIVPLHVLEDCAIQVLSKMFGHDGQFVPETASDLINLFELSDECVRSFFLNDGSRSPPTIYPYKTRCFEQTTAIEVWKWVFEVYGASHEFTEASFEDLLHWMALASPLLIESMNSEDIIQSFWKIWRANAELMQPRHLEYVTRLLQTPFWVAFAGQIVSEISSNIRMRFREDLDYVWVWCIHLKQTLKILQSRSPSRMKMAEKEVLFEFKLAIQSCMDILRYPEDSRKKIPRLHLVRFSTTDGNLRFVQKDDTRLMRKSLEFNKPPRDWFRRRSRDLTSASAKFVSYMKTAFML
jgi:hypothetical protein